jgi:hypothetical protein
VGSAPIPVLSQVRTERAREELKFLSYINRGKIQSPKVATTDPRLPEPPKLQSR